MREEMASLVHPVFEQGLRLREHLQTGAALNLDVEQAKLRGMLLSEHEARHLPDFGGDSRSQPRGDEAAEAPTFLGVRYALTCWLDELFILYSPWESDWNERKLEATLYGSNDRASKFWEQARIAENRGGDALEAYYLCVMLGFRGERRESPAELRHWAAAALARMGREPHGSWQPPPELDPPTYVPPLRGREKLQRMVLTCGMTLLFLIPVVVFFVVRRLGQ